MPDTSVLRRQRLLALLLVGSLGLAACGSGTSATDTAASGSPGSDTSAATESAASSPPDTEGSAPAGEEEPGETETPPVDDPTTRPDLPVADASAASPLAVVTVRDVTNDRWVQFADFAPSDKPTVYWFWAPH